MNRGEANPEDAAFIRRILSEGGLPQEHVVEAARRMERIGVLAHAQRTGAKHTTDGREALEAALPPSESASLLLGLVEQMGRRSV